MPVAWRACAFFILSRICCAACQRSPPSHHHVRLLDRLLPWLESEPLPLPASLLLPLTWANITGAAAAVELATETALRYAAKLCALPANPFCRINWQLFAARGETRQTLFTSRQKKAATLHAAKKLALALSLCIYLSLTKAAGSCSQIRRSFSGHSVCSQTCICQIKILWSRHIVATTTRQTEAAPRNSSVSSAVLSFLCPANKLGITTVTCG